MTGQEAKNTGQKTGRTDTLAHSNSHPISIPQCIILLSEADEGPEYKRQNQEPLRRQKQRKRKEGEKKTKRDHISEQKVLTQQKPQLPLQKQKKKANGTGPKKKGEKKALRGLPGNGR